MLKLAFRNCLFLPLKYGLSAAETLPCSIRKSGAFEPPLISPAGGLPVMEGGLSGFSVVPPHAHFLGITDSVIVCNHLPPPQESYYTSTPFATWLPGVMPKSGTYFFQELLQCMECIVRLGHVTCFGQWNVSGHDPGCVQVEAFNGLPTWLALLPSNHIPMLAALQPGSWSEKTWIRAEGVRTSDAHCCKPPEIFGVVCSSRILE